MKYIFWDKARLGSEGHAKVEKDRRVGKKQEMIQNEVCATSGRHDLVSMFEWRRPRKVLER